MSFWKSMTSRAVRLRPVKIGWVMMSFSRGIWMDWMQVRAEREQPDYRSRPLAAHA
jgi:hypothetical protein